MLEESLERVVGNPIGLLDYPIGGAPASQIKADSGLCGFSSLISCCSEELDHTDHNVLYVFIFIVHCRENLYRGRDTQISRGEAKGLGKEGMSGVCGGS